MQPGWELRVRAVADRWSAVVVLVALLTAAGGGWLVYGSYVQPPAATEERVVSTWATTGAFDHRATVRRANPVYPVGTTLADRPVYFAAIAPELDGAFRFSYEASDGGAVDVDVTLRRRLRAASRDGDRPYWTVSETIETAAVRAVEPGQDVGVSFSVNVSDAQARIDAIHEALGASPGRTEVDVVARVRIRGTVNGGPVEEERTYNLTLLPAGSTYEVEGGAPATAERRAVERVAVTRPPGPVRGVGGPLLLAVALASLGALGWARHRGSLSAAERERLAFADDRLEHDESITTGSVPDGLLEAPTVAVGSLGGLVELARATDRRVIEVPDRDRYVALAGDVVYAYEPPVPVDGSAHPLRDRPRP